MKNIGIIGLGLIGGSLGLELRNKGFRVFGVSQREKTRLRALERGIVDEISEGYSLLHQADLIFICTPIEAIAPTVKELIPHLKPETIITDVGSVKGTIVPELSALWTNFIGGHPMAGTTQSGVESGFLGLFNHAPYVLTPTEKTPPKALEIMTEMITVLNAHLYLCSPTEHDQAVAWISHLPVIISASLIQSCLNESNLSVLQLAKNLASSGFKDTSRVGGGNPELGVMMAKYNQTELLRSLRQYQQNLDQMIEDIQQGKWSNLAEKLHQNQQSRPDFLS
jgi:arogenate dehydrogenase (NADP+)